MAGVRMADLPATDTDVLVVGAGPTGLMAGLVLARRGIPVVVCDQKAGPTRESRALAVQARTMEIYDQLGLAGQVLSGAYPALRMQIGQDPPLGGVSIAGWQQGDTRFPGIQVFEQSANEQLLSGALAAAGTEVLWRHRLVDLVDDAGPGQGRVGALLEGPAGLVRVRARWCVGADGARSAVRRELDIPFEGVTDDATFWVADLRGVRGLPDNSMAARFGDATFAVAFPLGPAGHARLVALAPRDDIGQEEALAAARDDLGLTCDGVDWFSSYRVHHRVAAAFRKGPVFLAGDAGHVHSPVGGQGMNTGLQDAHNLALLLADVRQGRLDAAALERYEQERRPVAVMLVKVTDRLFGIIGRRNRWTALLRRRAGRAGAHLAPRLLSTRLGRRIGGYLGQYRIRYRFAAANAPTPAWAADRAVGLRLPPVQDNHVPLRTLAWQLHTYGTQAARPGLPAWIEGPHHFPADQKGRLQAGRLYLIRPDGYVAASLPIHSGHINRADLQDALAAHQLRT
jgi:2-polyprenyl-6-methoxyphenol hydroxylase-like FAD-dependent oxidoreductase